MIELEPELAFEYLDDGGVLVCLLPTGDYLQLGPPAGMLWRWIYESGDFDTVAEQLAQEFGVPRDQAERELTELCAELMRRGLVRRASGLEPPTDASE